MKMMVALMNKVIESTLSVQLLRKEVSQVRAELVEAQIRCRMWSDRYTELVEQRNAPTLSEQVFEFMTAMHQETPTEPTVRDRQALTLRIRLLEEELYELKTAVFDGMGRFSPNFYAIVDALADLAYVVEGSFIALGIRSQPVLDEVHQSNMTKVGGGLDTYGKARKGINYSPPDIESCIRDQGYSP